MLTLSSADVHHWAAALLWPLTRILGLMAASPLFGHASVPNSVKLGLGVLLAMIMAPLVPPEQALDPASMAGLLILVQQLLIGLGMGFTVRIVFAAVEMAGEISSMTMGLGFATFFDPNSRGNTSAISQFLALLATMAFISTNLHLVLLSALAESFVTLPISSQPVNGGGFHQLALWGGKIFSTGLHLALPVIAALLITNVALGILTRAAPQLNIFGIGFPVTLGIGLLAISMVLPYLAAPFQQWFLQGIEESRRLPRVWSREAGAGTAPAATAPAPAR